LMTMENVGNSGMVGVAGERGTLSPAVTSRQGSR
jgi:hypothetical protein